MNILDLSFDTPHHFRLLNMVNHIEMLFRKAQLQFPQQTIRWLDIACGSGNITNSVDVERLGDPPDYEIIGVELNQELVKIADRNKTKNRTFIAASAFELDDEVFGDGFHIVSAFEFLEHVDDPIALLQSIKKLSKGYIIAGSPLDEPVSHLPAEGHLWSFSQAGYENLFKAAGLCVTYSLQTHIGDYIGGHNWVTCIGSGVDGLDFKNVK